MKARELTPPQWADALLRSLLRPADREATSGDLLEEYRATRLPALGRLGADVWYIRQVISLLWRLIWPGLLVLAAQAFLALTVFRPGHHAPHPIHEPPAMWLSLSFKVFWYGSIVGAPGVSFFNAAIYFVAAYRGGQRTRLIRTGPIVAATTSLVGFVVLFASAAIVTPVLAVAPLASPVLFLILSVYLVVPLTYAALVGTLAGTLHRFAAMSRWAAAPPSA